MSKARTVRPVFKNQSEVCCVCAQARTADQCGHDFDCPIYGHLFYCSEICAVIDGYLEKNE